MKLKVKALNLTVDKPIAVLHKSIAEKLQVSEDSRIKIRRFYQDNYKKKWITAVVDVAVEILKVNEIALSQDIIKELHIKSGEFVEISAEPHPTSTNYIIKKMRGEKLNFTEMYSIISDISRGRLTESEIAFFISGVNYKGLDFNETINLTKAMVKTGSVLKHDQKYVLDFHSIGGVAGNRTSPIIVSLVAAAIDHLRLDAAIPKTASRAITSASGTADTMETICRVEFTSHEIKKIIEKTNGCLVWNSALRLSPSDDKIVKIESLVYLDSEPQLISSIMSKKIADGASHVLIDIPYGPSSKFSFKDAIRIKQKFMKTAEHFNIKVKIILTDGTQPIGNGVGPILEMKDIVSVLKNDKNRPLDLEEKSLLMAAELLSLTKHIKPKEALSVCKLLLYSGKAFQKFKQIVLAQDGRVNFEDILEPGKFKATIRSEVKGKIAKINNKKIAMIAKLAGSPGDRASGIYLHKHVNDSIEPNESIFTIYSESKEKLIFAEGMVKKIKPIEIK